MKKDIRFLLALMLAALCLSAAVYAENSAPVTENFELETYRGVSMGGKLAAVDPDGDVVTFEITTQPIKGSVELQEDGAFVYTPADGKRGKDYFGYKAIDSDGNYSQEATVIITLRKQKCKVTYNDMNCSGGQYAALYLAENNIYTGEHIGESYVFNEMSPVTRGEFLAMCMKASGTQTLSGVMTTGFSDDESIPQWIKPYVSTALMNGMIAGYSSENGAVFSSGNPISYYEAAVMLNNVFELTDFAASNENSDTIPAWASQAASNISRCDIMDGTDVQNADSLTRGEAAQMLLNAACMR